MIVVPGNNLSGRGGWIGWTKYTVDESDFTATAGQESITLYATLAGEVIHAVKIKHSEAFAGGAVADFTVEVGIAGNTNKYAAAFDVFQAVGDTTFSITGTVGAESHAAGVAILCTGTCASDDVADATAGSVDIWVLRSVAV